MGVENPAFVFWNFMNRLSQKDIVKLNSKKKDIFINKMGFVEGGNIEARGGKE